MTPIRHSYLIIGLIVSFICFYVVMKTTYLRFPHPECPTNPHNFSKSNKLLTDFPRIIMWTKFFGQWYGSLSDNRVGEVLVENCRAKCLVTNDPRMVEYSDVVLLHVRDMSVTDFPTQRLDWQKWVFYLMEAPPNTKFKDFNLVNDKFNWTMSYRKDSDVYVPYGRIVLRNATTAMATTRDMRAIWKSKKKTAVWIVSHCHTQSKREIFVRKLRRYMHVDVYGSCGNHKCPLSRGDSCYADFQHTYFYALAFENSICKDYVTEKFFTALQYDIVPVVLGGANYSEIAPHRSYIDALSFQSPKHLAKYLVRLSKNYTEYSTYFTWKGSHGVSQWNAGLCELCTALHNRVELQRTSSYGDIRKWWFDRSHCRSWK
ncbi:alpha-(1,3)-fucosyltransferase C [Rhipicephalus microplus]|uniref:alpha-(1,3)-fucosyltransferase C n=1 Tax=Rhipicephalus microplus TaxID=6941 RepID=UPI003F6A8C31